MMSREIKNRLPTAGGDFFWWTAVVTVLLIAYIIYDCHTVYDLVKLLI